MGRVVGVANRLYVVSNSIIRFEKILGQIASSRSLHGISTAHVRDKKSGSNLSRLFFYKVLS